MRNTLPHAGTSASAQGSASAANPPDNLITNPLDKPGAGDKLITNPLDKPGARDNLITNPLDKPGAGDNLIQNPLDKPTKREQDREQSK
jgi:hypothetical protein